MTQARLSITCFAITSNDRRQWQPAGVVMAEKWWHKAQERLENKLCLFGWQGYPRWPGIVVEPMGMSVTGATKRRHYTKKKALFGLPKVIMEAGAKQIDKTRIM